MAWRCPWFCCCSLKCCFCCCSLKCFGAIIALWLALWASFFYNYRGLFFAQDLYPRTGLGDTPVEIPALRESKCAREPAMCKPLELPSWEEAEEKASKTLLNMTSEERHSLMVGTGWISTPYFFMPAVPLKGHYMGNTPPIPRLGLPSLKEHDAGNGYRNNPAPSGKPGTATMWPSSLSFGATWDVKLIEQVAAAIGREFRGKGSNVILGPAVQVHRIARGGRNFEYMCGEDPYLGAKLSAAYVRGVQSEGVMACLKHFAFNEQEIDRTSIDSLIDDRTAWEIYYPPFEAGIAAGAGSIMCSYNRVNGTYSCSNEELLSRDLKRKMNFHGFVMSDWWALQDEAENSVVRGFDQEMPGAGAGTHLSHEKLEALERNRRGNYTGLAGLSGERLYNDAAFRILASMYKLRLDERPTCTPGADCVRAIDSDQRSREHSALSLDVTTKSVVLLKNDGILPIKASGGIKSIALVGIPLTAASFGEGGMAGDYYSGGGSGHCVILPQDMITPLMALKKRSHSLGIRIFESPSNDIEAAKSNASQADAVIVLAATTSGEGTDRPSLDLDFNANYLIRIMAQLKPTIVLLQTPGAVLMPWHESPAAIALMFLGGQHTSSAWEAIVFGDASPSGKLPLMIPVSVADTIEPSIGQGIVNYTKEGIFTSYRSNFKAVFPFGHGLSYTNFSYGVPEVLPKADCTTIACVQVTVSNIGNCPLPSSEVAQAYVEFPPELEYPRLMLKGFYKTAALKEGEQEVAMFNFTERDLSVYLHGGWQLQRNVVVHVGSSSVDLRGSVPLTVPMNE